MKRKVFIGMTVIILLCSVFLWNHLSEKSEQMQFKDEVILTSTNEDEIFELIKKADKIKMNIKYEFDADQIIGTIYNTDVVAVMGEYGDFKNIMNIFDLYYTEKTAKYEMSKIGLFELDGRVGMITADGEEPFLINDNSHFSLLHDEENYKQVKVSIIGENGTQKDFVYTIELVDQILKITEINEL